MRYLYVSGKILIYQVVLILVGGGVVFGEPAHISGAALGHNKSTIAHISGVIHLETNSPSVKTHVSGSDATVPIHKPVAIKTRVSKKARSIGVTLGTPNKSSSLKNTSKITKKTKDPKHASLQNQINHRKACGKVCENIWRVDVLKQCSALSDLLRNSCKKDLFKERLSCVRKNCREVTQ